MNEIFRLKSRQLFPWKRNRWLSDFIHPEFAPKNNEGKKKKLIAQFISHLFTLPSSNKEWCINLEIAGCHRLTSWEANKWKEETNFHSSIQSIFPWEHKLRKGICMISSGDLFTFEEAGLFRPSKIFKLEDRKHGIKGADGNKWPYSSWSRLARIARKEVGSFLLS